jgi:hypothetical protein
MDEVTFTSGVTSITIDAPQYGYNCELVMGLHKARAANGNVTIYDDGSAYDHRLCHVNWSLDELDAIALSNFLGNTARGENVTMTLSNTKSGFYPFGPDKGNVGAFTVRPVSWSEGGWGMQPYGYFDISVDLLMVTAPSYSVPTGRTEGVLSIGTISGLRWPDPGFSPTPDQGLSHQISRSGVPYVEDRTHKAESWVVDFPLRSCTANAAKLIEYIVGTVRGNAVNVSGGTRSWLAGPQDSVTSDRTYSCRIDIGDDQKCSIKMTHTDWDLWDIPMRFAILDKLTY